MPRRAGIARKTKYEQAPVNRTTERFHAKLMTNGKRRLAQRILRQALARAEASARRPGLSGHPRRRNTQLKRNPAQSFHPKRKLTL